MTDIHEKFGTEKFEVLETDHWKLVVRHKQITLGSCVAILNRQIGEFGELSRDECADLMSVYSNFEKACRIAFGARQFNYLALMMKDPHLHFHAIPRYPDPVEFNATTWRDEAYPRLVSMKHPEADEQVRLAIRSSLKSALSESV